MILREKIVIVCGAFDPLSFEDLRFLQTCKAKGNWLIVGVHSDFYLAQKHGGFMQDYAERRAIIEDLKCVDEVFSFNDTDGTVTQLLRIVKNCYPMSYIFYVSEEDMVNMPETKINGITFVTMKQE